MENEESLAINWKQHRGKLKQEWHSLTDQDLDIIAGNRTMLVSILQEKYGFTELTAQAEVNRYLLEHSATQPQSDQLSKARP